MRTIEKTVYTFEELDDSAKERAREYVRVNWLFQDSADWEYILDDAVSVGAILGIDIDQRMWTNSSGFSGKEPKIYFDLYRRDCAILADYRYSPKAPKKIEEYAPLDAELLRIAEGLQIIQRRNFYQLRARMDSTGRDISQKVDVYRYDEKGVDQDTEQAVNNFLTDFIRWILKQLENEYEYQNSDAAVDERLTAGGYEFTENGELS